ERKFRASWLSSMLLWRLDTPPVGHGSAQGQIVIRPVFIVSGPKVPTPDTSSRCQATPAPPAACVDVNGTSDSVIANRPVDVVPTTWMVAVPLKVATSPVTVSDPGVTRP